MVAAELARPAKYYKISTVVILRRYRVGQRRCLASAGWVQTSFIAGSCAGFVGDRDKITTDVVTEELR